MAGIIGGTVVLCIVALYCSSSGGAETAFILHVYFGVVDHLVWKHRFTTNAHCSVAADTLLLVCRHLAALKQRELENARVTAEEMEKQMGPLR